MTEAVIVSTARTALGKSFRGAFNDTEAPVLGGHAIKQAVARAGIDPADVDDCIMGAVAQQGTQAYNIGRLCGYVGGLPNTVPGMTGLTGTGGLPRAARPAPGWGRRGGRRGLRGFLLLAKPGTDFSPAVR